MALYSLKLCLPVLISYEEVDSKELVFLVIWDNSIGDNWIIDEIGYNPVLSGRYETIFTLSNGYMGIRGTMDCSSHVHRKGTFLSGVFDRGDAQVMELVNCPTFMNFDIAVNDENIDFAKCRKITYIRWLDMKQATLKMDAIVIDASGRELNIKCTKAVSMADKRTAFFTVNITPLNFFGRIKVSSEIDGTVSNYDRGGCREIRHYTVLEQKCKLRHAAVLAIETYDHRVNADIAACMSLRGSAGCQDIIMKGDKLVGEVAFDVRKGISYTIDKVICVLHSLDSSEICTPNRAAEYAESRFEMGVAELLKAHIDVMKSKWDMSDVEIEGDNEAQTAIRHNILNLIMLGANVDGNVSIGAKGLHGEGYKGHIFWDTEIFILPFYIYNQPLIARQLLLYRYNRLEAARAYAQSSGYNGARFPWESADSGSEATPEYFYPKEGAPIKCWTGLEEIHITADVAFAFYEYCRITSDVDFYLKYCAEVLLETASYWVSRLEFNNTSGCYEINSVIGPDEYHIHVNNSSYINYLVRWNILKASEIWEDLRKNYKDAFEMICEKTGIGEEDIKLWKEKAGKIYLNYGSDGVLEQFNGYFELKDYTVNKYNEKGMPVLPPNFKGEKDFWGYRLIKQADVVMLLHLFNDQFSEKQKRINYEYYEKRTIHWSSLSPGIYCLMGVNTKIPGKAYAYFNVSANTDLEDNQGNTEDGIHAAAVGGTWQAMVLGFGGFRVKDGSAHLDPWLPKRWKSVRYKVLWKGKTISVLVSKNNVKVLISGCSSSESFNIFILERPYIVEAGKELNVPVKLSGR